MTPINNNQMSEQEIQEDLIILMHKKDYSYLPDTADKAQMEIDSDIARIKRVTDYILTLINRERAEAEKAYGGCHKCYGKGYSTQILGEEALADFPSDKDYEVKPYPQMIFCTCDRGKQLKGFVTSEKKQAVKDFVEDSRKYTTAEFTEKLRYCLDTYLNSLERKE